VVPKAPRARHQGDGLSAGIELNPYFVGTGAAHSPFINFLALSIT
jgi:hypothetical protein